MQPFDRRSFIQKITAGLGLLGLAKFVPAASAAPVVDFPPPSASPPLASTYDPALLLWGTYGKPPHFHAMRIVQLGDCETNHLQAILRTEDWHLNHVYRDGICHILRSRGVEPIPESERQTECPARYETSSWR